MNVEIKSWKKRSQKKLIKKKLCNGNVNRKRRRKKRNFSNNTKSKNKNQRESFVLIKVAINKNTLMKHAI